MLGSFKIRLLLVIIIAALAGLSMQSEHGSKKVVEPVIKYIMKDYGIQNQIADFFNKKNDGQEAESHPVSGGSSLQLPCEFIEIEREYGWHYNASHQVQEFFPAVLIKVAEGSKVRPVYEGLVADISSEVTGKTVLIDHGGGLYSSYGGLEEALVEVGQKVGKDTVIGNSSQELYFQVTGKDGPLNPNKIFKP